MKSAVLFDLGNTLVAYYRRDEFMPILERIISNMHSELRSRNLVSIEYDIALKRAIAENREASDFHFIPLADRLSRIFELSVVKNPSLAYVLYEKFLNPIFKTGKIYHDTFPALKELKFAGIKTAIVSNSPWGSPPELWRKELIRLGLSEIVDCIILCGDVGWRKPAPQIFMHAVKQLDVQCNQCVFVGDELQWDISGSAAVGMHPVLIDRDNVHKDFSGDRIIDLNNISALLHKD